MEREVRYCRAEDGTRIAYCVEGEGEGPPLLALPSFIESFSLDHLFPEHRSFLLKLAEGRQLIRFDPRGVGLSQRDMTDLSPDALIGDGFAVAAACCGSRPLVVWASATTGPYAIRAALGRPELVARLVLYGTCASLRRAFPPGMLDAFASVAAVNWPLAAQTFADMTGRKVVPEATLRLADWFQQSTSGPAAAEFIRRNAGLDMNEDLGRVQTPTLVMHRMDDPTFRFELGREMAAGIPGSRFVPLQGAANLPTFGDEEPIIAAAQAFLDEDLPASRRRRAEPAPPAVQAVLFTDIVGHTSMMRRLGDEKGRLVLREHEQITREALGACGGTEVKTIGDGFMASFPSVSKAVECAIGLQRAFDERNQVSPEPLQVRVGLNAGEPIQEEGDLFGTSVILAARIASNAQGGEILASLAVRELCAGKGFLFADLGEHVMRGFEDPVRVFAVRWRED